MNGIEDVVEAGQVPLQAVGRDQYGLILGVLYTIR